MLMDDLEMKYDTTTHNERTLYSLRHFYATMALQKDRMSIYQVARNIGTSVKMIEDFYADEISSANYEGMYFD